MNKKTIVLGSNNKYLEGRGTEIFGEQILIQGSCVGKNTDTIEEIIDKAESIASTVKEAIDDKSKYMVYVSTSGFSMRYHIIRLLKEEGITVISLVMRKNESDIFEYIGFLEI